MTESLNIKLKNVFLKLQNIQIFKNLNFDFSSNGVSIILDANGGEIQFHDNGTEIGAFHFSCIRLFGL